MSDLSRIRVVQANGQSAAIDVEIFGRPPYNIKVSGFINGVFEGTDLFDCLIRLRTELEKNNAILLCNGARIDVFPSGMARSMGAARMAYVLRIGVQASVLVDIFDYAEGSQVGTVSQQQEFFRRWVQSLVK